MQECKSNIIYTYLTSVISLTYHLFHTWLLESFLVTLFNMFKCSFWCFSQNTLLNYIYLFTHFRGSKWIHLTLGMLKDKDLNCAWDMSEPWHLLHLLLWILYMALVSSCSAMIFIKHCTLHYTLHHRSGPSLVRLGHGVPPKTGSS